MKTSSQTKQPPLLQVKNLSLSFQDQQLLAIDRVSFSIAAGRTLGLVGASGAGKSSIARAILRLSKADSGEILFAGNDVFGMTPEQLATTRQRVQLVFQEPSTSLSPRRTIKQSLLEPLKHFDIGDKHSRMEKVRQTLQTVGLDQDVLSCYPHQFSGGQQQRIAIARALVTDPDLLIADEAVSSLDVSIQAQILQLIQTLQRQSRIAILFISHDLAVVRQIADEVAVMYRGQLMEYSPVDNFFNQPAHPYSKALLSFSRNDTPKTPMPETWRLEHGRSRNEHSTACAFAVNCPEKTPRCEQVEPVFYKAQRGNQNTAGLHCVKCHLYDEVINDEK